MAARQQHGFDYQEYVIKQLDLKADTNYIGENDAYCMEKNGIDYPILIKFIKKGSAIDLSDYKRNKNRDKDFVLIVGFWEGIKGNIVEEHVLCPPHEWWQGLFMIDNDFDEDMYNFLKNISNDKSEDVIWKKTIKEFKIRWNDYWKENKTEFENFWDCVCPERLIQPRFKRDHKKQKRIQCAVSNKNFYKYFLRW